MVFAQEGQAPFQGSPHAIPGTIQCEDFDNGGQGVAYSDKNPSNDGNQYRTTGVDISVCSKGGFEVGSVFAGEWLEYTVEIATAGSYTVEARVASAGAGGSFHIEFDGVNKTGAIAVPNTGAWSSYRTAAKTAISLGAGRQVMRVAMDSNGPSGAVANFNYFRIAESGDAMDTNPAMVGQWVERRDMPAVAIHMHLLPNGKVLFWQADDISLISQSRVWDIETNSFTTITNSNTNVFCSGHSFLPDGRLLVAGGHHLESAKGEPHTNIFDFRTNTWSRGPNMNAGRWYPSTCTLANGDVLVVSGTDEDFQFNNLPQVWEGNGWRSLTGAVRWLPFYPWMALAPDGRVFCAPRSSWL